MRTIHAIADELAARLGRSIAINDYSLDLIAASSQEGPIDKYRIDSFVYRHTPKEVLTLLHATATLNHAPRAHNAAEPARVSG